LTSQIYCLVQAVEYLRLYLTARREGSIHPEIPPEEIQDDSPLIRDEMYEIPHPIGEKQLYKIIHTLYFKAGLLEKNEKGHYDLRPHSLRKFFKTQMESAGVKSDYVEYMMGHTVDTYHDIQSKGVEFLRNVYATAGLSIAPQQKGWELDALKAFARELGLEPKRVLTETAFAEPHRTYVASEDREQAQTRTLSMAIKGLVVRELQLSNRGQSEGTCV
jgi:hypothetical protein